MRKASAPTLFALGLLVLAVLGGATFGIVQLTGLDDDGDGGAVATTTTPTSDPGLAADQVAVTGTATAITVEGAVISDVVVPTVVTPSAGLSAGARIAGALVDGELATIAWDAGRPLTLAAETPLRLHPAPVNLAAIPGAIVVTFVDDSVHAVVPGDYEIDASVAVTTTGLGQPRDSVTFTATDDTTVVFTGGANGAMAPGPISATGPGRVLLQGTFQVRHPDGTVTEATSVELPTGSFRLAFAPLEDGTGYVVSDALLEGATIAT